ncbi:MAG: cupin [Candidatus Marinimicrobia bacterium]|nr:cupin [Candidatus Neomarinimicrobiota bacterium]|tara:strand:- start:17441 stop:17803 length:363 start_codon:yes stop_codon:yes gene_type:complete
MIDKLNWSNINVEEVNSSLKRQIIYGKNIMVAKMKIKEGFIVPLHYHENEQLSQVISGSIRFWFGENREKTLDLFAGEIVVIPGNLPHEALMLEDVEVVDTFSPPRQDWIDGSDDYIRNK